VLNGATSLHLMAIAEKRVRPPGEPDQQQRPIPEVLESLAPAREEDEEVLAWGLA
jgi:hypothetical protein